MLEKSPVFSYGYLAMVVAALTGCDQLGRLERARGLCVECHEEDRARSQSIDHYQTGFPGDCTLCHVTSSWTPVDLTCDICHGSAKSDAPPKGITGETATSAVGVGAHQAHLTSSNWHAAVACEHCHLVPKKLDDPGHLGSKLPAEVRFSGLASHGQTAPTWDGTRCSSTYCHGATLAGGSSTAPVWTKVDGTASACGSCHGLPPGGDHPTSDQCQDCHAQSVDANRTIIAPKLHINGKVESTGGHPAGYGDGAVHGPDFFADPTKCQDCHGNSLEGGSGKTGKSCASADCHAAGWKTDCTFCHGGVDSNGGAPPASVNGLTGTTVPGVGRHTTHTTSTSTHAAYPCKLCHKVPIDALSPGHVGLAPAELTFTGQASGSSYSAKTRQCSNVYCHGDGLSAKGSAVWTGSLAGGCGSCHSNVPFSGKHRRHNNENVGCEACHQCVVSPAKQIIGPALHVNGSPNVCGPSGWNPTQRSCTPSCHEPKPW